MWTEISKRWANVPSPECPDSARCVTRLSANWFACPNSFNSHNNPGRKRCFVLCIFRWMVRKVKECANMEGHEPRHPGPESLLGNTVLTCCPVVLGLALAFPCGFYYIGSRRSRLWKLSY